MGIARGFAPQFGVQVNNITVGSGWLTPVGATVRYTSQREDFADGSGETVGQYFWNHKLEATIDVFPLGTSAANANTAAIISTAFQTGKTVALTAANDSDLNSTWVITDASKTKREGGRTTHSLTIERFITHGANIAANEITV